MPVYVSEYFEHGMIVDDISKLHHRYVSSTAFKLDVISLLPTDLVFLVSFSYQSRVVIARISRVLRMLSLHAQSQHIL